MGLSLLSPKDSHLQREMWEADDTAAHAGRELMLFMRAVMLFMKFKANFNAQLSVQKP